MPDHPMDPELDEYYEKLSELVVGMTAPATHRPSYTSPVHTACGLRFDATTRLQLGDGETCERCTHVVAQVAAARNGEPSWAAR